MELRETECFFCHSILINVRSDSDNLRKYLKYISVETDEETWKTPNQFTFCWGCSQLLRTFSERLEGEEGDRDRDVNSSIQDICRVMLKSDVKGRDFGVFRGEIVDRSISLLEEAKNLPPPLDGPFSVESESENESEPEIDTHFTSSSGNIEGNKLAKRSYENEMTKTKSSNGFFGNESKASRNKIRRPGGPLPEFILWKGNTFIYNKSQPLYHCKICNKDFPSCSLSYHRKHRNGGKDLDDSGLPLDAEEKEEEEEVDVDAMEIEVEKSETESESDDDDDDMEEYRKNLEALGMEGLERSEPKPGPSRDMTRNGSAAAPMSSSADANNLTFGIQSGAYRSDMITNSDGAIKPRNRKRKGGFAAQPLPDFITRKKRIFIYNQNHYVFHCSLCDVDIVGPNLTWHKKTKHGIEPSFTRARAKSAD